VDRSELNRGLSGTTHRQWSSLLGGTTQTMNQTGAASRTTGVHGGVSGTYYYYNYECTEDSPASSSGVATANDINKRPEQPPGLTTISTRLVFTGARLTTNQLTTRRCLRWDYNNNQMEESPEQSKVQCTEDSPASSEMAILQLGIISITLSHGYSQSC
jgi:hypothetical protein